MEALYIKVMALIVIAMLCAALGHTESSLALMTVAMAELGEKLWKAQ